VPSPTPPAGLLDSWLRGRTAAFRGAEDCFSAALAGGPAALDVPRWLTLVLPPTVDDGDRGADLRSSRPKLLRAGVMEDAAVRRSISGTPQGGVISACLCNVYLHRLDR
jgi:hypothetical protein